MGYQETKAFINANIKQNGKNEITGNILNTALNDVLDSGHEEVVQLGQKILAIKHMGISSSLWNDWEVGDYMYYTKTKFFIVVLGVDGSGNITSYRDFQPILGAIYTYDNQLYIWNGTDLIQKTKDVSISQIVQNGDIDGIVTIGSDSFAIRNATHDESYGLKNGYIWSSGWNNDPTRVSAKILNAKLASIRVVCDGNIKIAAYITLNDDYSYAGYTSLSNQTIQDITLDTGHYYQVLFMFKNGGNITPQDVLPHISIGQSIRIQTLENRVDGLEADSFKSKTPFLWSKLSRVKNLKDIFANIGFIGDSWTQGTENIVGGVTNGFESYDKWVAKALWEEYGYGGLGWLDFARDGGAGKMFGCIDMYEHWSYAFSGNVTGLDGSTSGQASQCLGICCAHTIFGKGSSLALSFNAGYLDRFKIRYYKNAHFNVSVNGGSPVEITANATDGWQETEFGVAGTDITSVEITSLADNSIIFGMDCYYGTYGVRCHKIGNRSIQAANYLSMDATQWEQGMAKLELCWASVLLAINDLGESTDPTMMDTIVTNIGNLINRLKVANDDGNGLVTCDINLLGVENIEAAGWTGLGMLAAKQKEFALANGYGWTSTDKCVGATKAEFVHNKTFSDSIHLNIIGSYAYGQHIYNSLFRF